MDSRELKPSLAELFDFLTSIYILLFACWLYAYFRFMNQYKIKIIPNELTKYIVYSMIIGWVLVTLPSLKNI